MPSSSFSVSVPEAVVDRLLPACAHEEAELGTPRVLSSSPSTRTRPGHVLWRPRRGGAPRASQTPRAPEGGVGVLVYLMSATATLPAAVHDWHPDTPTAYFDLMLVG